MITQKQYTFLNRIVDLYHNFNKNLTSNFNNGKLSSSGICFPFKLSYTLLELILPKFQRDCK